MAYTPIVGTLGFILSPDKTSVLMVHRTRETDGSFGLYNGLGGKMEVKESISDCMKREIFEESGLRVVRMRLRASLNWTGFGPENHDWLCFVFMIDEYEGIPFDKNDEGLLAWHKIESLCDLPMWEGDRQFIPMLFDPRPGMFHGFMPYDGSRMVGFTYEWM